MSPRLDPTMEDLPVEVMVDILSRLPVKTIIHCKCVCKKWLNIILDSYFADVQFLRSPACVMLNCPQGGILKWVEVEVENEVNHHHLHHDPVMSINLNYSPVFQKSGVLLAGAVNGLVCLWQYGRRDTDNTCICNPITREYMFLPKQQDYLALDIVYCFGIGSLTREYKVIRILISGPGRLEVEVYTLGTGQWRNLGHVPYWLKSHNGLCLNGHAHWTVLDSDSPEKICAFDFDKETFDLFPSPPSEAKCVTLGVLKGCLCRCEFDGDKLTVSVWVMKEYGIKKSWLKEFVIESSMSRDLDRVTMGYMYIVEGRKDGTILMASCSDKIFTYCPRRKTIVNVDIFVGFFFRLAYRPGFHRLHNFVKESVHVF